MMIGQSLLKSPKHIRAFKKTMEYDLYTRRFIQESVRTIEHIVPSRWLSGNEKMDTCNLYVIHNRINRFRSDYRFGGTLEEVLETVDEWEHIDHHVFRNPRHRLFFPMYGRPLIAYTCRKMLQKYEHLQDIRDHIFVTQDLDIWTQEGMDEFDHQLFIKNYRWSRNIR